MLNIIAMGYNWTFECFLEKAENRKDIRILHVFLPKNRKEKLQDTIAICERLGLGWSIPENKDSLIEDVRKIDKTAGIDLGVVCAYMMIVPPEVLKIPKYGVINLHLSLLPKHRGAHPVQWAMIQGDRYTGCTVHYMTEEVDKGDILLQERISIGNHDIVYLMRILADIGSSLICRALELFEKGRKPEGKPQKESDATLDPARKPEDGEIKIESSAIDAMRLIRSLTKPWPGAFIFDEGKKLTIYEGELIKSSPNKKEKSVSTGKIFWKNNNPYLMLKDGNIRITKWE